MWPRTSPASVSSIPQYSKAGRTLPSRSRELRWWMFRLRVESWALEATSVAMWSVRLAPPINTGTLAISPDR